MAADGQNIFGFWVFLLKTFSESFTTCQIIRTYMEYLHQMHVLNF